MSNINFIDFWDDDVVIPSVRIFHRHPSFKEKLLMVIWLMSDDFNIVKIHLMMTLVDMAHNFGIFIEHQNSLFCSHLHLQWSFCLAIVHKIALSAIDFVHYSRRWMVGFIRCLSTKRLFWCSIKIPKLQAMSTTVIIRWTLTMLKSLHGHEPNYHQQLFLEAWVSVKDTNAGNDHIVIPDVYKCLACF